MAIDNFSTLKNINRTLDAYKSVKGVSSEIKKRLNNIGNFDIENLSSKNPLNSENIKNVVKSEASNLLDKLINTYSFIKEKV